MKRKKLLMRIAILTAMTLLLGGCGNKSGNIDKTDKPEKKDEQVISFMATDFKSLDPNIIADGGSFTALTNIYEGLMRQIVHEDGTVTSEFAGAEGVDISDDKLTYTFHLRKDAKWSDGKPVTADQYVYSWKRIINPDTAADYMTLLAELNIKGAQEVIDSLDDVEKAKKLIDNIGVEAKDDYTFVVTLSKPTPFLLNALTIKVLVPVRKDQVEEQGDLFGSDFKTMVYNGPFVISDYNKGSNLTYSKNESFWNKDNVKIETGKGVITENSATAIKMFTAGEIDVVTATGEDLKKLKKDSEEGKYNYHKQTGSVSNYLYFNMNKPVVKNTKVRQALSYVINREEFCDIVYDKYVPAYGLVPAQISSSDKDYRKEVEEPLKSVQKEDVKKLMEEGLKEEGVNAKDVNINLLLNPRSLTEEKSGQYLQKLYKDTFGINLNIEYATDYQTLVKKLNEGEFDISTGGWGADYDDVSSFFNVFTAKNPNNAGGYNNPEYEKIVIEANSEEDSNKRVEDYKKAEKILLVDDAAVIPLLYYDKDSFRQNYVKDYMIPRFAGSYDLSRAYIEGK